MRRILNSITFCFYCNLSVWIVLHGLVLTHEWHLVAQHCISKSEVDRNWCVYGCSLWDKPCIVCEQESYLFPCNIYICSSKKGLKLILSTQTYDVALQSTTAACMHLSVGHFWLWFLMQLRAKRLSGREWRQQGFAWFQYRDMCKICLCSPSSCPHEESLCITVL